MLRVVPPSDPETGPAQDTAAPAEAEARPVRRASGQRAGGHDWADVLMGGGPVVQPRQDRDGRS